jgi:hypothetical protein
MRIFLLIMMIAVALIFLVSCGEKEQEPEQIDKKTRKGVPQPGAPVEQRMSEFSTMMSSKLETINKKTADLNSKLDQVPLENQAEFTRAIDILKKQQKIARDELKKLNTSTTDNWDKFAPGMAKVMKELQQAYIKAESYLKKGQ